MLRQRLAAGHKVSMSDIEAMQADTTLPDAEYFVPHITEAFADAKTSAVPQPAALAADPQVAEAVRRLGQWDFTTPTGIAQGYDAGPGPARHRDPAGEHRIADPAGARGLTAAAGHPPRMFVKASGGTGNAWGGGHENENWLSITIT